ncbi:MAG TPA: hypothetical protein VK009_01545, partial [Chloroflexota bacterium]|nr:hypothetical protein [Chloroflexota bacterium]
AFVYDFLADDGWELLVGLVIVLPLTFIAAQQAEALAAAVLLAGVLATLTISLARKAQAVSRSSS